MTKFYSEHIDLFPTLAEAAAGVAIPVCPKGDASFDVMLCTEGSSLVPMMKDPTTPVKLAAFSQYPRGYVKPTAEGGSYLTAPEELSLVGTPTESSCIKDDTAGGCTMGYTMATLVDGCEYR